jgi:hypothetical protein
MLLLFSIVVVGSSSVPVAKYPPTFPLFSKGELGISCYRIPILLTIESNTVLAFAEARINNCGDIGPKNIAYRRSKNGGHSWSATEFIYNDTLPSNATRGLNMGAATYDATTKEVFVHFGECVHLKGCNASALFIKSSNGGLTFSKGEIVNDSAFRRVCSNLWLAQLFRSRTLSSCPRFLLLRLARAQESS